MLAYPHTKSTDHIGLFARTKLPGLFFLFALLVAIASSFPAQAAAKIKCGDGICRGGETALTCSIDCDASAEFCGDGSCGSAESCDTCAEDCGTCPAATACNYDGICNLGEDCQGCADCAGVTGGKKSERFCCGGSVEDALYCVAEDCGTDCGTPVAPLAVCGNGTEEQPEECDDGNTIEGDGCDQNCKIEPDPWCGDANTDPGEECDDGNNIDGDGCSADCTEEVSPGSAPVNQFNIGDSIGEAEALDGTIGSVNHQSVWSTGYSSTDNINSLNERFEQNDSALYYENDELRDGIFNKAVSGADMADFQQQAQAVIDSLAATPTGDAGQITIMLGNNDVCADSNAAMTDAATFEQQFRAGLEILAKHEGTREAHIHVSSIPAIYWLWESRADDSALSWCRLFAWPNVPCQNLLSDSADDCATLESRRNPDVIDNNDGPNCQRRKEFHALIRDVYNPVLQRVVAEFENRANLPLPNIGYIDMFDTRFDKQHVNGGDCFHPSFDGHRLLSDEQYCRSEWNQGGVSCAN